MLVQSFYKHKGDGNLVTGVQKPNFKGSSKSSTRVRGRNLVEMIIMSVRMFKKFTVEGNIREESKENMNLLQSQRRPGSYGRTKEMNPIALLWLASYMWMQGPSFLNAQKLS